ncbi:MAG: hypothetical protein KF708_15990 [Pirellulales bacterium]|nr:hypothetical protein [Pirellulales bacterium]
MSEQLITPSLQEALAQIGEIRAQMTEATVFRGYRALPVAVTGVLGLMAAVAQATWIPDPGQNLVEYTMLWVGVAAVSVALVLLQLFERYRTTDSKLVRHGIIQALEKFGPCVLAGALVTLAILRFSRETAPLLPGLWATFFSLGIFASWRNLPRPSLLIGAFYLLAGTFLITAAGNGDSLSPYGMGQLATAAVLYFTLERNHGPIE